MRSVIRSVVAIGVSAVLALSLGVLASFIAFKWFERDVTDLDITLESDAAAVQALPGLSGVVTVSFDGRQVSHLRVLTVSVRNSGNTEIEAAGFAAPVTFTLDEGEFLSADVVDRTPDDVDMDIELAEPSSVRLTPSLLNPGDEIRLALVTTSQREGALEVKARVSGIKRIGLVSPEVEPPEGGAGIQPVEIVAGLLAGVAAATAGALFSGGLFLRVSRPSLSLRLGSEAVSPDRQHKFLHVAAFNTGRRTAHACRALVTIRDRATGEILVSSMPADWSSTPEPLFQVWDASRGVVTVLADPSKVAARKQVSIEDGAVEQFAVALKHEGEPECFAFNADNYFGEKGWRLAEHRLPSGEYDVEIKLESDDSRPETSTYLLTNGGPGVADCRLGQVA